MKHFWMVAAAVAFAAGTARAEPNFPLGTWVYEGSVMDYRNEVLGADSGLVIQAVSSNGTVMSVCTVVDADGNGTNFRLEVPVSTRATGKSAAVGDALNCVVVSPSGAHLASTAPFPPVGGAVGVTNCVVKYVAAKEYAYGEAGTVLVPDEYLSAIAYMMEASGHAEYEPAADWDEDGVDNYSEFIHGTNPFDESDFLDLKLVEATAEGHVFSFEYVGGHLYALQSVENLLSPDWADTPFSSSLDEGKSFPEATRTRAVFGTGDDVGEAYLLVVPASESPEVFYRIEVK